MYVLPPFLIKSFCFLLAAAAAAGWLLCFSCSC